MEKDQVEQPQEDIEEEEEDDLDFNLDTQDFKDAIKVVLDKFTPGISHQIIL
jgi:hypothetical protein